MSRVSHAAHPRQAGFSLIEISLAIMIIAVGLLSIFSLFPAGLKQSESAYRDTQAGLFADQMLNGIRRNAAAIDSWTDWSSMSTFMARSVLDVGVVPTASSVAVEFPPGSGHHVRYMLEFGSLGDRRTVSLWVWGSKYGPRDSIFRQKANWFYSEFYYRGDPDA